MKIVAISAMITILLNQSLLAFHLVDIGDDANLNEINSKVVIEKDTIILISEKNILKEYFKRNSHNVKVYTTPKENKILMKYYKNLYRTNGVTIKRIGK